MKPTKSKKFREVAEFFEQIEMKELTDDDVLRLLIKHKHEHITGEEKFVITGVELHRMHTTIACGMFISSLHEMVLENIMAAHKSLASYTGEQILKGCFEALLKQNEKERLAHEKTET